jgi:hypothetical protein
MQLDLELEAGARIFAMTREGEESSSRRRLVGVAEGIPFRRPANRKSFAGSTIPPRSRARASRPQRGIMREEGRMRR